MTNLPTIDTSERLIHGSLLKCVDGRWSTQDDPDMTFHQLLALTTVKAIQRWQLKEPIESVVDTGAGLPDIDELNAKIPRTEWELGLDREPRPPWQRQYVVYLLDASDASIFTFANGTIGARMAWERLVDRVSWMRALRGTAVFPLITLDSRPMKTQFGTKLRPEFSITDWRDLGGTGKPALESTPPRAIEARQRHPSASRSRRRRRTKRSTTKFHSEGACRDPRRPNSCGEGTSRLPVPAARQAAGHA